MIYIYFKYFNLFGCAESFLNYLFIFGSARSLLLHGLFSSYGEWGLLSHYGERASHHDRVSFCGAWALGPRVFICGTWAQ